MALRRISGGRLQEPGVRTTLWNIYRLSTDDRVDESEIDARGLERRDAAGRDPHDIRRAGGVLNNTAVHVTGDRQSAVRGLRSTNRVEPGQVVPSKRRGNHVSG